MTKEEILKEVQEVIAEQLDVDIEKVTPSTDIKNDLEADSLDVFEIMNELEDKLDGKFAPDESIVTVQNVVDYIDGALEK